MVHGNASGVNGVLCERPARTESSVKMHDAGKGHQKGQGMTAQANVAGMARLLYVVAGAAAASWGLWGADQGWTQWTWLALGGVVLVLGIIGYSPLHSLFGAGDQKAS